MMLSHTESQVIRLWCLSRGNTSFTKIGHIIRMPSEVLRKFMFTPDTHQCRSVMSARKTAGSPKYVNPDLCPERCRTQPFGHLDSQTAEIRFGHLLADHLQLWNFG